MSAYAEVPLMASDPDAYLRDQELLAAVRDGAWLDRQDFPPVRFAIPSMLPEGYTLLAGPPKAGKSWLVLNWCLAVAAGGMALGAIAIPHPSRVLYLALEDSDRRMQDRVRAILEGQPIPKMFEYATRCEPGAVLSTIAAQLRIHPDTRLVVLDTLGRVLPPALAGESSYSRDYRIGAALKGIVDAHPGTALLVVHHDRKAEAGDFVAAVSGTNGLAGAADSVMVLSRDRHSSDGVLSLTGRDVRDAEYAIRLHDGRAWQLAGGSLADARKAAGLVRAQARLGDGMQSVLAAVLDADEPVSPTQVAKATGMDARKVSVYLHRAVEAGHIDRLKRGLFAAPSNPVGCVDLLYSDASDYNNTTQPTQVQVGR